MQNKESKNRNYIRVQYQKDEKCISYVVESKEAISLANLIYALAILPSKVAEKYGSELKPKVAVACVNLMMKYFKNSNYLQQGHGNSNSTYLDRKRGKKGNSTERVDIEINGLVGKDLLENKMITDLSLFVQNDFQKLT